MAGPEAVEVAGLAELELLPEVGADVLELELDLWVGRFERGEAGEGLGSIRVTALLDQETGRLRVDISDGSSERETNVTRTSGSQIIPMVRMKAQMSWMPVGMRHAEWSSRFLVALLMTEARRRPMVMAHW